MNKELREVVLIILIGFAPLISIAQYSFQNVFGGQGDDWSVKAIELPSGNFLFLGTSTSYPESNYLSCFNNKGQTLWTKTFQYHGTGAEDKLYDLILASDGYVYVGGSGFVWNSEGNPIYSKFDLSGNLVFDSAYTLPLIGLTCGSISRILDEPDTKSLASIGFGSDNVNGYPMFQKTRYTGERIYYRYITQLPGMGSFAFFNSPNQFGYNLLCGSSDSKKYLTFLDSAGNFINKKYLLTTSKYANSCLVRKDGTIIYCDWEEPVDLSNPIGKFVLFSPNGDSLRSKVIPTNHYGIEFLSIGDTSFLLFGPTLTFFDSNLNQTKAVKIFNDTDAVEFTNVAVAKDGGVFGVAKYSGGSQRTLMDPNDFYFFKTYPDGTLTPQISFMRTGVKELKRKNKTDAILYPNPCDDVLNISSEQKELIIQIYNQLGQKILEQKGDTLVTSSISEGIYLVKLRTGNEEIEYRKAIIIKH